MYYIYCNDADVEIIRDILESYEHLIVYLRPRNPYETYLPERYIAVISEYLTDVGLMREIKNNPVLNTMLSEKKMKVVKSLESKTCLL